MFRDKGLTYTMTRVLGCSLAREDMQISCHDDTVQNNCNYWYYPDNHRNLLKTWHKTYIALKHTEIFCWVVSFYCSTAKTHIRAVMVSFSSCFDESTYQCGTAVNCGEKQSFSFYFKNIVLTSFWTVIPTCFHSYMCHYTSYIIELICVFIYVCNLEIQLIKLCCLLLLPRVHNCAQNTPPGYDYRQARSRN